MLSPAWCWPVNQEISEVTLSLQERPCRPVDPLELAPDGDALFFDHDEPVGVVQITVVRG